MRHSHFFNEPFLSSSSGISAILWTPSVNRGVGRRWQSAQPKRERKGRGSLAAGSNEGGEEEEWKTSPWNVVKLPAQRASPRLSKGAGVKGGRLVTTNSDSRRFFWFSDICKKKVSWWKCKTKKAAVIPVQINREGFGRPGWFESSPDLENRS